MKKLLHEVLPERRLVCDGALGGPAALAAGANIIGACCGRTLKHTRAIRQVVESFNRSH